MGVVECHPKFNESHTIKVEFHTKIVGCHPKFKIKKSLIYRLSLIKTHKITQNHTKV
jgi:hypothetical protein